MASGNAVWGIDIGQCALKAIKLRPAENDQVEVLAFDVIEHPKILSQPDAEPDEIISAALEKFVSRNEWQKDRFVIGVPGQQTFSRFVKMPPVDPRKIPEMVEFEAGQQIPFDMSDVVWDYQVFQRKDQPDVEVGIFAMRRDLIRAQLDRFSSLGVAPVAIQTLPAALYNFCRFEMRDQLNEEQALIIVDVGAQNTDLIIVEANGAWMRNIPLGGNAFTEALVKRFKLSFAKAENLKRTAATSKYAREIFQTMRPVFADLVAEIQRSLGFYSSTHREVELKTVLASGNAFRLPGLQKYLENNLTLSGGVLKLEKFNRVAGTTTANAPQFLENALSFGAAYGLALQGLGMSAISANLLPPELARIAMWNKKRPYFMAAAACLGLAAMFPWLRNTMDKSALGSTSQKEVNDAKQIVDEASRNKSEFAKAEGETQAKQEQIKKLFELQSQKALLPAMLSLVHDSLPEVDPALESAKSATELKDLLKKNPGRFERTKRRQILIESVKFQYAGNIDEFVRPEISRAFGGTGAGASGVPSLSGGRGGRMAMGGGGGGGNEPTQVAGADGGEATAPGFWVAVTGRVLYGTNESEATQLFTEDFYNRLLTIGTQAGRGFFIPENDEKARDRRNLPLPNISRLFVSTPGVGRPVLPGAAASEGPVVLFPDPLTGEEMKDDWSFSFGFKVKLGEPPKKEPAADAAPEKG